MGSFHNQKLDSLPKTLETCVTAINRVFGEMRSAEFGLQLARFKTGSLMILPLQALMRERYWVMSISETMISLPGYKLLAKAMYKVNAFGGSFGENNFITVRH